MPDPSARERGGGERDAPQSVSSAAHEAAVCGFELAYAAMITHFLGMLEKKRKQYRAEIIREAGFSPFITNSRVDKLGHGVRPHILDPLLIVEDLQDEEMIISPSLAFASKAPGRHSNIKRKLGTHLVHRGNRQDLDGGDLAP
jgi:hypothetical protein